jgi:hypothetical protein
MNDKFADLVEKVNGGMAFETSICFHFWKSLSRMDIEFIGWRLAAYWRGRGYDV